MGNRMRSPAAVAGSVLAILVISAPVSFAETNSSAAEASADYDGILLQQVYQRGLGEIAQAEIAAQRSEHPQVRELAQLVLAQQRNLNRALKELADRQRIALPAAPLDEDRQVLERLRTLHGQALDSSFLRDRVQGLMRQTNILYKLAAQASDPAVKALAENQAPRMDEIRQRALELRVAVAPIEDGPVGAVPNASQPAETSGEIPGDGTGERVNATSSSN